LVNAAGFTGVPNVDACEIRKAECLLGNVALPLVVRQVCERRRLPWAQISSGCIYSQIGDEEHAYRESDPPNFTFRQNNCSFYSGCKALAEESLHDAPQCYIWRLRIPFSHVDSARNYLSKVMRYARLLDARNSLAHVDEFADACLDAWQNRIPFGTYNLTNTGSISTREIVEMIRRGGQCDKDFQFFASQTEFMRVAATAPRSTCTLDNSKARDAGLRLTHVADAIGKALHGWKWEQSAPSR
jgi:dTDP-4-dehydrorhamnose reductase